MGRVSKLIDETVLLNAKEELKALGDEGVVAQRLRAVVAAKKHGISRVAEIFNITNATLISWIKRSKNKNSMILLSKTPRSKRLNQEQIDIMAGWVRKDPNYTLTEISTKCQKEFKITVSKSTVHNYLKKLGLSHITPRPKHYKQNPVEVADFKAKIGEKK